MIPKNKDVNNSVNNQRRFRSLLDVCRPAVCVPAVAVCVADAGQKVSGAVPHLPSELLAPPVPHEV